MSAWLKLTGYSKDGELVQTITHPAISVWAVAAMPNGDIVTGCSDGLVRVFSRSESRWANEETLKVCPRLGIPWQWTHFDYRSLKRK